MLEDTNSLDGAQLCYLSSPLMAPDSWWLVKTSLNLFYPWDAYVEYVNRMVPILVSPFVNAIPHKRFDIDLIFY